jgi:SAM-dependent methyltransferase
MNWTTPYVTSRSLTLTVSADGKLLATNSISRLPCEIEPGVIPLLQAFAAGGTPRAAWERLVEGWEVDEGAFAEAVAELIAQNLLTEDAPAARGAALARWGFAVPHTHHYMLKDGLRVDAYRAAIERHAPGRRVLEIGCGVGVLSLFAARAGALRVDAVEESEIAAAATELFAASPWRDRIFLHRANSQDVALAEPAEVLVHELFATDPFAENVLPSLADARARLLSPDARLLPAHLEVLCLGIDGEGSDLASPRRFRREAAQYAARYGLDLDPWIERLAHTDLQFQTLVTAEKPVRMLSDECLVASIDFARDDLAAAQPLPSPVLHIREPGTLEGLLVFFRARFGDGIEISTAPDAPKTAWGQELRMLSAPRQVVAGDRVRLSARIDNVFGRQGLNLQLDAG